MPAIAVFIASAVGAVFVLALGVELPERVASHFGVGGQADAYTSREVFVAAMCMLTAAVPSFVWSLQDWAIRRKKTNLPNAEFWFSAELQATTSRYLRTHAAIFSVLLVTFLCYTYWLVVQANQVEPASVKLNTTSFVLGLGAFLAATAAWLVALHIRFRRGGA